MQASHLQQLAPALFWKQSQWPGLGILFALGANQLFFGSRFREVIGLIPEVGTENLRKALIGDGLGRRCRGNLDPLVAGAARME